MYFGTSGGISLLERPATDVSRSYKAVFTRCFYTGRVRSGYTVLCDSAWFFYVVKCFDQSFYAGITTDVSRRVEQHNSGRGAKCLRRRTKRPVRLVYYERHETRSAALTREAEFKKLSHAEKFEIVRLGHKV